MNSYNFSMAMKRLKWTNDHQESFAVLTARTRRFVDAFKTLK